MAIGQGEENSKENSKKEPSEKEKEKNLQRQIIWLFAILGLVLVSFLIARNFNLIGNNPCTSYEGFQICKVRLGQSDLFFYSIPVDFMVNGKKTSTNVVLRYNPKDLQNITYSVDSGMLIANKIWLTMDPALSARAVEIAFEVGKFTENMISTSFALTSYSEKSAIDVINCENASSSVRVVLFELGNETYVKNEGNCIHVSGTDYDNMEMASDRLAFEWLLTLKK